MAPHIIAIDNIRKWRQRSLRSPLNLSKLYLTDLPEELFQLTNLRTLHLDRNHLNKLPKDIERLENLEILSLNSNDFFEFPMEILQLKNLKILHFGDNSLREIPKEISQLKNLKILHLENNYLREIPKEISQLKELNHLYLENNSLRELPREISQLKELNHLYLENNNLSDLPKGIVNLKQLERLSLTDNSGLLEQIPNEILEGENAQKILNYYSNIKRDGQPLNEAKIVVIGEADFGKTLLINRLIKNNYVETKSTTGIKTNVWRMKVKNTEIRLNVWDFGGQEIMHSTHQIFFTNRTVYILVVDARQNEDKNRTVEWLKRIESFGGNSPVIIVGSHIDQNQRDKAQKGKGYFDISRRELTERFNNIKAFFGVCSDTRKKGYDKFFNDFKKGLINEITKLTDIDKLFPPHWLSVKEDLESMREKKISYISDHDYLAKCFEKNIKDPISKETIREFLNEIGTVIYFRDLPERMVFNPEWITQGVYALVDNTEIIDNKGEVEISYLTQILNSKGYKQDEHKYILALMKKFQLCVEIEPNKRYLIPDLLMKATEPNNIGNWNDALIFQFHYETYLKNIFTQFVVEMYPYIYRKLWWRNGVVLEYEESKALVIFDSYSKKVIIKLIGSKFKKRALLGIIRKEFHKIHGTFQNLGVTEWIAHPTIKIPDGNEKQKELLKDYQELVCMEEDGVLVDYVKELRKSLPIAEWLEGVESKQSRRNNLMSNKQSKYSFPNAKQVTIYEKAEGEFSVNYENHSINIEEFKETLDEVSARMNNTQRQTMEKIADDLINKVERSFSNLTEEEKSEIEQAKKGKWDVKIKTLIPIVPKVPGFDALPSMRLEIERSIEPTEFISTIQKWLYGKNRPLSILETDEDSEQFKLLNK